MCQIKKDETSSHAFPKLRSFPECQDREKLIKFCEASKAKEILIRELERHAPITEEFHQILKESVLAKTKKGLPQNISEQANMVHKTLSDYWSCDCPPPSRKIYLYLPSLHEPNISDGSATFYLLFSTSDDGYYQEGVILVGANDQTTEAKTMQPGTKR